MRTRRCLSMLLSVGIAMLLAGCAGEDPTPAPATAVAETIEEVEQTQSELALANTSWEAESFGGPGDMIPVIPDTYPSLYFMGERYSGFTGCDYFLGVYSVEGNSLQLEAPDMTEYGCSETALSDQGATYADMLWNVSTYELQDEKLLLYAVEDQLMVTMVPLESLPFEGTTWDLKFYSPELAYWEALIPGTVVTAKFDGELITGTAGCNDYSAPYTRSGNQLSFGEFTVTYSTCDEPDGVMDQESAYLSMLVTAGRLAESARSIELLTEDGTPLLMYHGEPGPQQD